MPGHPGSHLASAANEENALVSGVESALAQLMAVRGALTAALVDSGSGMVLASVGAIEGIDLTAAFATELVRAQRSSMLASAMNGDVEDILITASTQLQVIRPLRSSTQLFIYFAVDRSIGNLSMARFSVLHCDEALTL